MPPAGLVRLSAEYLLDLERCAITIIGPLYDIASARHGTAHGIQHARGMVSNRPRACPQRRCDPKSRSSERMTADGH